MSALRVGVVGVGSIGKNHARIYADSKQATLSAVYDANLSVAKDIAKKYGCEAVPDLDALIASVDCASVCTPTTTHFEVASRLLAAGKHLLVEKPITETTDQARKLAELAKANNLILQVGHIERFNPVLGALEARLTHPRFIESHRLSPFPNRSTDIGVVLDLMIHDLEIILHLVRSPVAHVDAVGIPVLSSREDIANARIRFENGCVANITVSRISPEKLRKIRVFQEDAYLSLDYQNQSGEIYRKENGQISRVKVPIEKEEPLKMELESFLDCCQAGVSPKVDGHQAADALELALSITRQIEMQVPIQPNLIP